MDWRDQGFVLQRRPHGETSAIVEVFTPSHGRHAGVVRGGAGRKAAAMLQPGAQVDIAWRARLEDHLGVFRIEPVRSRAAAMTDRLSLAGLNAVTAMLTFCLPEREAHPALYNASEQLLDLLGQEDIWPLAYLRWEMRLLDDMGYRLDLTHCAVTQSTEDLVFVSPKSGRAVSRAGAGAWARRMLPLPPVLRGAGDGPDREVVTALDTTGYFLREHLARDLGNTPLPEARARFLEVLARRIAD